MMNLEIRRAALDNGITFRRIAAEMKIKPSNLSAMLKMELKPAKRAQILAVIAQLAEQDRHESEVNAQ